MPGPEFGYLGQVIVALALSVALGAMLALGLALFTRRQRRTLDLLTDRAHPVIQQAAIIVNPTKFANIDLIRRRLTGVCQDHGWAEPLWLETTAADPGQGQARQALAAGADLICPLGGDGTVRAVAEALAHTAVPLGLLPGGTGNLLARNLGLPIGSIEEALSVALTGSNRVIDVGRVTFLPLAQGQPTPSRLFLVMAGIGIDAAMMAETPERLKAQVGWIAYAYSGLRHLRRPRTRAVMVTDGSAEVIRRVHSVLVANCGQLAGGIVLLPEAAVDDGWLDAVTLSPKGLTNWAQATAKVLSGRSHDRVQHQRLRSIEVQVDRPTHGQVDGDAIGVVRGLQASIDPDALIVRVAAAHLL